MRLVCEVAFIAAVLLASGCQTPDEGARERENAAEAPESSAASNEIELGRALHFFVPAPGETIVLAPGFYRVERADDSHLRVVSMTGDEVTLPAEAGQTDAKLAGSLAEVSVSGADDAHIVLFQADGSVVAAAGSLSGIVPRGTRYQPRYPSTYTPKVVSTSSVSPSRSTVSTNPLLAPRPYASDFAHTNKVRVTWQSVAGADKYRVFRCTSGDSRSCRVGFDARQSPYDDTGATPGARYYYRIKSCLKSKCGSLSGYDSGSRALSAPTGMTATDDNQILRVGLVWGPVPGASSYRVFRCTTTSSSQCGSGASSSTNTYYDTGGLAGVVYYYRARACSAAGCSALSSYNAGSIRALSPPTSVQASTTLSATAPVTVLWSSPYGSSGSFTVFRCEYASLSSCTAAAADASSPYYDMGGQPGAPYQYRVKACMGSFGCSDFSESDPGMRSAIPGAPPSVSASMDTFTDKVRLNWEASADTEAYRIYRCIGNAVTQCTDLGETAGLTHDDTGAEPGVLYKYRVVACHTPGSTNGSACNSLMFTAKADGRRAAG